jgi:DNA-binding beta-propeller fold protein YncE
MVALIVAACGAAPGKPGTSSAVGTPTAASTAAPRPATSPATAKPAAPTSGVKPTPAGNYGFQMVLLARGDDWALVSSDDGQVMSSVPAGVATANWEAVYTATPNGSVTAVKTAFVEDGSSGTRWSVDGAWVIPTVGLAGTPTGLSRDGRTLVLAEADPSATESRFALLGTRGPAARRIITLPGRFAFDAISPDGSVLYAIQFRDAEADYVVRSINAATGKLDDAIVVDKRDPGELMAGIPIEQHQAALGKVYTLYQGPEHAFIHLLFTVDRQAACIDLPAAWGTDQANAAGWGVALSPDEQRLFVANTARGVIAEVDTTSLGLLRTSSFAPSASIQLAKFGGGKAGPAGGAMVLSPDRSTLYLADDSGVLAIDTKDLSPKARLLPRTAVVSLGMADNGNVLYAVTRSGAAMRVDPFSGDVLSTIGGTGYTAVLRIVEPQ